MEKSVFALVDIHAVSTDSGGASGGLSNAHRELLLLADPSWPKVEACLKRGTLYEAVLRSVEPSQIQGEVANATNSTEADAPPVSGEMVGVLVLAPEIQEPAGLQKGLDPTESVDRPPGLEITHIAVAPHHQGQGFARSMIQFAKDSARTQGYSSIVIRTANSSIGPLALYQKSGFRMESIVKDYFVNHYPTEDGKPMLEDGIPVLDQVCLRCSVEPS